MSETYKTDAENPPPLWPSVSYWERSGDPFHADAFKGLELGDKQALFIGGMGDVLNKPKAATRAQGWMAIEWTENPVGFVADGTEYQVAEKAEYVIHDNGPNPNIVAEPKAVDFFIARWWPRYYYVLEAHEYTFDTLHKIAHDKDTLYVVMGQDVYAKLRDDLERVLILKENSEEATPQFAGKPLFVEPPADVRGNRRGMELPGKFAIGRKRRTRRPCGGNLSEFLNDDGKEMR